MRMWESAARFWAEASAAVADLGVLIPIAVALIVVNGLSATPVLLPAGLLYLVVAFVYRAPVAVQPLKAFGAAAIAIGAGADVIAAGSLLMGVIFVTLGASSLLDRVATYIPRAVIRGVQLAVGLTFARIAVVLVTAPPRSFAHQLGAPWLPWAGLGLLVGMLAIRRGTALLAVAGGLAIAAFLGWGQNVASLGPTAIAFPHLSWAAFVTAATVLVAPQIPLTLTNSCLAPADAASVYFPQDARRITPNRLAVSLGAANIFAGAISGMPLCHGAGGMSAHHAFGGRTWRTPALIGTALTAAALFLGRDLAGILMSFPLPVLAALLGVAAVTHIRLLGDLRGWPDWTLALGIGALGASGQLLIAVVGGTLIANIAGIGARRPGGLLVALPAVVDPTHEEHRTPGTHDPDRPIRRG